MAQMAIFFWRRQYMAGVLPYRRRERLDAARACRRVRRDAAGRYSILREGDKDTGCMLTLDARVARSRRPEGAACSRLP